MASPDRFADSRVLASTSWNAAGTDCARLEKGVVLFALLYGPYTHLICTNFLTRAHQ